MAFGLIYLNSSAVIKMTRGDPTTTIGTTPKFGTVPIAVAREINCK